MGMAYTSLGSSDSPSVPFTVRPTSRLLNLADLNSPDESKLRPATLLDTPLLYSWRLGAQHRRNHEGKVDGSVHLLWSRGHVRDDFQELLAVEV
jgi:hypothetical protein